jgi:hypothetical protein
MDEADIEREIDAKLEGEMAKRRADLRNEIIMRERRRRFNEHMDKINSHDPKINPRAAVELPVSAEEQAQRDRWARESLAAQDERIRANDARFERGEKQRAEALKARRSRPLPTMRTGGSEGFTKRSVV